MLFHLAPWSKNSFHILFWLWQNNIWEAAFLCFHHKHSLFWVSLPGSSVSDKLHATENTHRLWLRHLLIGNLAKPRNSLLSKLCADGYCWERVSKDSSIALFYNHPLFVMQRERERDSEFKEDFKMWTCQSFCVRSAFEGTLASSVQHLKLFWARWFFSHMRGRTR